MSNVARFVYGYSIPGFVDVYFDNLMSIGDLCAASYTDIDVVGKLELAICMDRILPAYAVQQNACSVSARKRVYASDSDASCHEHRAALRNLDHRTSSLCSRMIAV